MKPLAVSDGVQTPGCYLIKIKILWVKVGSRERMGTSLMEREGDEQILRWNSVST